MFANTQMGGVCIGFPDVCLTPMPVPVPIPYPNIALEPIGIPAAYNVLWGCTPAHNMGTFVPLTLGDTPGVAMGIITHAVMAQSRCITAAFTVLVMGLPATRMTSITMQNFFNCLGIAIVPSQLKVLLLAP